MRIRWEATLGDFDILKRGALLREGKTSADTIPVVLDRLNRYEVIAEEAREIDIGLSKQCVRDAISITTKVEDPEADPIRLRIVDLANRIDPDLAASLASSLDDDEARNEARAKIELQALRKKIAEGGNEHIPTGLDSADVASEFWSLLGQLNAGKVEPIPVDASRQYVEYASTLPLREAYPILAWALQNAIERRSQAEQSRKLLRGFFDAALIGCELSRTLTGIAADKFQRFVQHSTVRADEASVLVHSGQRGPALQYIREWIAANASHYLKICDPYFGPDDLEILQIVLGSAPNIRVSVLTSKRYQDNQRFDVPIEEFYANRWRQISDQAPPKNEIVVVGGASGALPIHDRWWLTRGHGLRIGTSLNSLGGKRESEISIMTAEEVEQREREVDEYLTFRKREHEGQALNIHVFSISTRK